MSNENKDGTSLSELLAQKNKFGGNHIDHQVEAVWAAHETARRDAGLGQQQMGQAEQPLAAPEELGGPTNG